MVTKMKSIIEEMETKYGKIVALMAGVATIIACIWAILVVFFPAKPTEIPDDMEDHIDIALEGDNNQVETAIAEEIGINNQSESTIMIDGDINNQNGTVIINNGVINVTDVTTQSPDSNISYGTEEETRLLQQAKQYFEDGDLESAFRIYTSEELRNNDYATINRAYFYAHGYIVDCNPDYAMELYNSVDSDDARRNTLALMIACNDDGQYTDEIDSSLQYFISKKDYYVLNFLSLCMDEKRIDPSTVDHVDYDISKLKRYRLVWSRYFTVSQNSMTRPFDKLVLHGTVTGAVSPWEHGIYYQYCYYRLNNFEWIDRLYG